ncbi:MAG: response regulator [Deltaproteobacteria bacterium]|nr:response regulator [Deltaproteobacteria bacterium]
MKVKTILVVEPDAKARQHLESLLTNAQFKVVLATDEIIGQKIFETDVVDAVIAEINASGIKGVEFTRILKKIRQVPVIMMTQISDLNETLQAYEAGVDGFVAKPVHKEELIEVISACLGLANVTEGSFKDQDFCRINVHDFVVGTQIKYDVYIKLTGQKYVKIAHRGEDLSTERVDTYKARDVQYLYMLKSDFKKYVGHVMERHAARFAALDSAARTSLVKHTGEVIMQQLFVDDLSEETYAGAKAFVENMVASVTEDMDAFKLIAVLNNHADFIYAHSVAVSFYGTLLAKQVKWTSSPNLFKVAMGGLLHDIGKKEIDRAILLKPRVELTAEEARQLDSHPLRGRDILCQLPGIPTDIIQIVLQHHEDCAGQGRPFGLKKERIHPLARLLSVADTFCHLALKSPDSAGMSPKEAIERMLVLHRGSLDPVFLTALAEVFHLEAPDSRTQWRGLFIKKAS